MSANPLAYANAELTTECEGLDRNLLIRASGTDAWSAAVDMMRTAHEHGAYAILAGCSKPSDAEIVVRMRGRRDVLEDVWAEIQRARGRYDVQLPAGVAS